MAAWITNPVGIQNDFARVLFHATISRRFSWESSEPQTSSTVQIQRTSGFHVKRTFAKFAIELKPSVQALGSYLGRERYLYGNSWVTRDVRFDKDPVYVIFLGNLAQFPGSGLTLFRQVFYTYYSSLNTLYGLFDIKTGDGFKPM